MTKKFNRFSFGIGIVVALLVACAIGASADTNNHAIRVIDLAQTEVTTLILTGLNLITSRMNTHETSQVTDLPQQAVRPGENLLHISLDFPEGYKLNPDSGLEVIVKVVPGEEEGITNKAFPVLSVLRNASLMFCHCFDGTIA